MSEFNEPWHREHQIDGDNLIRGKHWKRGVGDCGIVCGYTGDFSGFGRLFVPSSEQMDRIVACVNFCRNVPTKFLLATTAEHVIDDRFWKLQPDGSYALGFQPETPTE